MTMFNYSSINIIQCIWTKINFLVYLKELNYFDTIKISNNRLSCLTEIKSKSGQTHKAAKMATSKSTALLALQQLAQVGVSES